MNPQQHNPVPPAPAFFQDEIYLKKEEEEHLEIQEPPQINIWPPLPID